VVVVLPDSIDGYGFESGWDLVLIVVGKVERDFGFVVYVGPDYRVALDGCLVGFVDAACAGDVAGVAGVAGCPNYSCHLHVVDLNIFDCPPVEVF
jgi:hypothetical protein